MANSPSYLTDEFKRKLTATILAESADGQEETIRWVYETNTRKAGGLKGLEKSTAYKKTEVWYKVWLYMLGDQTHASDALPTEGSRAKSFVGYKTVKEFCDKNGWMQSVARRRAEKTKKLVDAMYKEGATNPYKDWIGQGNIDDFNRNDSYWRAAREYYWLQVDKKVNEKLVEIIPGSPKSRTQFLFHADKIKKHFDNYKKLSDKSKVKEFTLSDVP